jgi:DNA-binding SARP family transcriptional activator
MRRQRAAGPDRRNAPVDADARTYDGVVRFEVLGSTRVVAAVDSGRRGGATTTPSLGGPKQRLVLALLLAEPNRVVSIDRLVDGLWGDDPPETARHTVTRKPTLGRGDDGAGYRIHVGRDTLDTLDFEARVAEARTRAASDPGGAAAELETALGLWRGPAFDDFPEQAALRSEAARLEELRLAAVEALMQARLSAGQHADVIVELERLTREHPYREELRALHMVALYRSGRQADALRAYQATRDVLGEELGIAPSPRLRRLEEQILLQDPDLDPAPDRSDMHSPENRWIENPYLGLRAFREADHARFFGQDQLVDRLVARVVGDARFTALVGARAGQRRAGGLVPARHDHPGTPDASPGHSPRRERHRSLGRRPAVVRPQHRRMAVECVSDASDGRAIARRDQFEELFTIVEGTEATGSSLATPGT